MNFTTILLHHNSDPIRLVIIALGLHISFDLVEGEIQICAETPIEKASHFGTEAAVNGPASHQHNGCNLPV